MTDGAPIPSPALVWLVGPSGAGKSTWASERYPHNEIVSSDALRAVVGSGPHDMDASVDAFDLVERIASARLDRGLGVVIDTLGFDDELRRRLGVVASGTRVPYVAVVFETPDEVCRERNRRRDRPVPAKVLDAQLARRAAAREVIEGDGWPILAPGSDVEPSHAPGAASARRLQVANPRTLSFFLQLSDFRWAGAEGLGDRLVEVARSAEGVGFEGISVMDHLVQIPQVGRAWDPLPEAFTTLAVLAGATERLRLSPLVVNAALRHPSVLGRMVATLDVLSGGRAECAIGAGWFEKEHQMLGLPFPATGARLDAVDDLLRYLPVLWGPGGKPFEGTTFSVQEAIGYPRPIQERIPLVVGGGGELRTMRIAAEHADGWNFPGMHSELPAKLDVMRSHCEAVGRDPSSIDVSVLDVTVCGRDANHVGALVEQHRGRTSAVAWSRRFHPGTVDQQIGRYRLLADQGVSRVYVSLVDLDGPDTLERFGPVVEAFA